MQPKPTLPYPLAFALSPCAQLIADADGVIVAANQAACRLLGAGEAALCGTRCAPLPANASERALGGGLRLIVLEPECAAASAGLPMSVGKSVLELIAHGAPLPRVLTALAQGIERANPEVRASVLLLARDNRHLLLGAAPSLPDFYNEAVHGLAIGDGVGACGTAAARGERVIVEDIASHPYWAPYTALARAADLAACWSEPVVSPQGKVLGTFALYHARPASPTEADIAAITEAAHLASVAIERSRTLEAMQLSDLILRASSEAMLVMDDARRIQTVNPAFTTLTGYPESEAVGLDARVLRGPSNRPERIDMVEAELRAKGRWQGEFWLATREGAEFPARLTLDSVAHGSHAHTVAIFSDFSQKKAAERAIWQQANHDNLTGLPNRRHLLDRLARQMTASAGRLAVLFVDLDHFKNVNDSQGHGAGDALLVEAGRRLLSCVRAGDMVARIGGDEFVVLVAEADQVQAGRLAERILDALCRPFVLNGEACHISASVGVALHDTLAGADAETLLGQADLAMYAAKQQGRNSAHFYVDALQQAALERSQMLRELRDALRRQAFTLVYQPVVELATGRIRKAEALLRWQNDAGEPVSPDRFIPLAEEAGLMPEIGEWVLQQAAKQAARWRRLDPGFVVSVNVSPVQFRRERSSVPLTETITSLAGSAVGITEGVLLDADPAVQAQLLRLRDAGVEVAIDDFGTGYSSLAYLQKFDIDSLKIDRRFVQHLHLSGVDLALCEAVIVMAHKLGLSVVAEGIECEAQRALLARAGCDYGQGFLFSPGVPADALTARLVACRAAETSSAP